MFLSTIYPVVLLLPSSRKGVTQVAHPLRKLSDSKSDQRENGPVYMRLQPSQRTALSTQGDILPRSKQHHHIWETWSSAARSTGVPHQTTHQESARKYPSQPSLARPCHQLQRQRGGTGAPPRLGVTCVWVLLDSNFFQLPASLRVLLYLRDLRDLRGKPFLLPAGRPAATSSACVGR